MKNCANFIFRLRWFCLLVGFFVSAALPIHKTNATPIPGRCDAKTDRTPRYALISAFSSEADRFISEMRRNNRENRYEGCIVINGHRYSKGRLRGKDVVVVLTNISGSPE